jgi:outer membrane protein assembly factor BamB
MRDGSLVIHVPLMLARVDRDGGVERFPISGLRGLSNEMQPFASSSSGGWPLLMATEGDSLWMVVGRGGPRADNALACVGFDEGGLPFTRWVLGVRGLIQAESDEPVAARADMLGEGTWGWQPGPVLHEGKLFVQARQLPEEDGETRGERVWLCAFDAWTGRLIWKRDLGRPADLGQESAGRFGSGALASSPGMPLALVSGRVFVGTNAGSCSLVDAVDGRLVWSFKNRRREEGAVGWAGSRPPSMALGPAGVNTLSWAPFDSDYLYELRAEPDLGRGLLSGRPWEQGEAIDVVTLDARGAVLLGRSGSRRVVLERRPGEETKLRLYLGRAERFGGRALASQERVLLTSDRALYLFDRSRELLLLTAVPLEEGGGGGVWAAGDRIWVLGEDALWTFEAF